MAALSDARASALAVDEFLALPAVQAAEKQSASATVAALVALLRRLSDGGAAAAIACVDANEAAFAARGLVAAQVHALGLG